MRLHLLGSGSADGWPNAFCACPNCLSARDASIIRTPTSVLVDGRLLLDCGPEAPRQAVRSGVSLDRVEVIWIGHDHPDHNSPMALLARSWAGKSPWRRPRLTVVAAAATLAAWGEWIGRDDDVDLVPVAAGDEVTVGGYRLLAVAANHATTSGPGLVVRVLDRHGAAVLYACDTAALPPATVAALRGVEVDVALIDATFGDRADLAEAHGHLDLSGLGEQVSVLRGAGVVGAATDVLAVHLSHHNPPEAELTRRLAEFGARAARDHDVLDTSTRADRHLASQPGADAGRRTLVVGGARSGKSTTAERLLGESAAVEYVATGHPPDDSDPDWAQRVSAHRRRRPTTWRTVETIDLVPLLRSPGPPLLIDCLTLWLSRTLDVAGAWDERSGTSNDEPVQRVHDEIDTLAAAWRDTPRVVVAVSNEVGSGVVPATVSGRVFRDLQGRLNSALGADADRVLLCVAGRTVTLDPPMDRTPS